MARGLEHGSANIVPDTDAFRLRRFTDRLVRVDAAEIRDERIDLIDVADALDGNAKSVYELTPPFGDRTPNYMVPATPTLDGKRSENVLMALEDGPKMSCQLMPALEELRRSGGLDLPEDEEYRLAGAPASRE